MSDKKQPVGGVVLYPLEYKINRDNADESYVICKTLEGKVVAFFVNPPDEARKKMETDPAATIPRINKFGEVHRKATNPCVASTDNDKNNPDGILLGEQVSEVGQIQVDFNGAEITISKLEGRWASVLRDSREGLRAPIGFGYLEANSSPKLSPLGTDLKLRYDEVLKVLKNPDAHPNVDLVDLMAEKARLAGAIQAEKKKWFVGVLIHARRTITLSPDAHYSFHDMVQTELLRSTRQGVYGGVLIRARKGDVVHTDLCRTFEHQYDYVKRVVKPIETVMSDFMKYSGNKLLRECAKLDLEIDIIPLERFNCGKPGNDRYGKDFSASSSKVLKTYVDNDFHDDPLVNLKGISGYIYSRVGMRLAQTVNDGTENLLLSSIHAFSKPIGSILSIDKDGNPSYKLDRKKVEQGEVAVAA